MKTIDKKLVDELIRIMKKYWETGDTGLLHERHPVKDELKEILDEENADCIVDAIDDLTRIMYFKGVTYDTVYEIINLLGYEFAEEEE